MWAARTSSAFCPRAASATAHGSRRTSTRGSCGTRSACEGLPALERSVGRAIREPLVRTAAGLREDAEELQCRADEVLPDVFEETPEGADLHAVSAVATSRARSRGGSWRMRCTRSERPAIAPTSSPCSIWRRGGRGGDAICRRDRRHGAAGSMFTSLALPRAPVRASCPDRERGRRRERHRARFPSLHWPPTWRPTNPTSTAS